MEIQKPFFLRRIKDAREAKGITNLDNLQIWNLRGKVTSIKDLMLTFREKLKGFELVIFDPIYKLYGDADENSASDITKICNHLDELSLSSGCAIVFAAHFAKGNPQMKTQTDRISGSGVFARDPDSIITLTPIRTPDHYRVEATLRNLPPFASYYIVRRHPLFHVADVAEPLNVRTKNLKKYKYDMGAFVDLVTEPLLDRDFKERAEAIGIRGGTYANMKRRAVEDNLIKTEKGKWVKIKQ